MQIEEREYTPYLSRMMAFVCVMDNRETMDKVICKSTKHIKDKHQNGKPCNKKKSQNVWSVDVVWCKKMYNAMDKGYKGTKHKVM